MNLFVTAQHGDHHHLIRFLDKLDSRFKTKHKKFLAKPRSYGNPSNKPAPDDIPTWMLISSLGDATTTSFDETNIEQSDCESEVNSEEEQ